MRLAIRTVFFHFFCILLFAIFYYNFKDHYYHNVQELRQTFLDYFLLSTTIQAGVGISDIYPITTSGRIIMISQQLIMIMTHVFTLYFFNL
jgi:hypothetical protein